MLPIATPLAYGYQFYAFPLAILEGREEARDWVLSNYIQTAFDLAPDSPVPFCFYVDDFTRSPWLETQTLTRQFCRSRGDRIDDLVRDAIRDGWYVYLTVNERHIPDRLAYVNEIDYPHDLLVYGFDDDDDTFAILGYDQDQMFRPTTSPQESFRTAFEAMGEGDFYDTGIILYRFDDTGRYELDPVFVADAIEEYLVGTNTSQRYQASQAALDRDWGMQGYSALVGHLKRYADGAEPFNILNVQVLWEHKRLMVARAERCGELGAAVSEIVPELRRIERRAWTLRTMMLATSSGDLEGFRRDAVPLLEEIAAAEPEVLTTLVAALRDLAREPVS
ncbi:hypothetical protein ACFWGN_03275 [Oerskovia sp. NPDC060338]|uniref:hypothetical protein n=1 Tax=Oerskovia sp. NPDC060338 TaxID=3347100 RepID=UPI003646AD71